MIGRKFSWFYKVFGRFSVIIIFCFSDANWWKGTNFRGEGLFPASFVTADLNADLDPPGGKILEKMPFRIFSVIVDGCLRRRFG